MKIYTLDDLIDEIGDWLSLNEDKWDWEDGIGSRIILHDQNVSGLIKNVIELYNTK